MPTSDDDLAQNFSELLPAELLILDLRVAEPRPEFASSEEITKIFGRPFTA